MTTALAITADQTNWSEVQVAALRQLGLGNSSPADLAVFFHQAKQTGLDPFSRQIYMIERAGRPTIQASIDGLRITAQRSGEYAGQTAPMWCGDDGVWKDVWLSKTAPTAARVGVYRQGFVEPLYAVALLGSYMPTMKDGKPMGLWAKMPDVMLSKVAEALALRKAFPNDLSGIYSSEEMEQADVKHTAVVVEQVSPLDHAELMGIARQIQDATNKTQLRQIWKDNAPNLDQTWENTLGEPVSLKALITSRVAEVPETESEVA
jgi:phage recombination protein Bet